MQGAMVPTTNKRIEGMTLLNVTDSTLVSTRIIVIMDITDTRGISITIIMIAHIIKAIIVDSRPTVQINFSKIPAITANQQGTIAAADMEETGATTGIAPSAIFTTLRADLSVGGARRRGTMEVTEIGSKEIVDRTVIKIVSTLITGDIHIIPVIILITVNNRRRQQ